MKKLAAICLAAPLLLATACDREANIASENIKTAAEQFQIVRRITFINVISNTYLLTVTGRCSIDVQPSENQLEVTCKTDNGSYLKHHLGLADNVTYVSEQLEPSDVSGQHYKVMYRPLTVIPSVEVDVKGD